MKIATHAQHVASPLAQRFDGAQAAAAGGDQVFDHDHFGSRPVFALDLVGQPVRFRRAADVDKRLAHFFGDQYAVRDSSGGYAGDDVRVGIFFGDDLHESFVDFLPDSRIGEDLAVIAVDGRVPADAQVKCLSDLI